jgi:ABC-type sugar transport system permease subunit
VIYLLTAGGPARHRDGQYLRVPVRVPVVNLGFASAASYLMILMMLVIAAVLARSIGRLEDI